MPAAVTPRTLFLSHRADHTGAPKSLAILVRHLVEGDGLDARVLLARDGPTRRAFSVAAPTDAWPASPRFRTRLAAELRAWAPELVVVNTAVCGLLLRELGLAEGVPVVTWVHELGWTLDRLPAADRDAFLAGSDRFLAASEAVRGHLIDTLGVEAGLVTVLPECLEIGADRAAAGVVPRTEVEAQLGIPADALLVGNGGFVGPRKGPDLFVEAAAELLRRRASGGRPLRFVWLGDGPDLDATRARVEELGLADRIAFPGLRRDPHPVLARMDLLLMTSRDDPFPRIVLEAGSHGVPAVCFAEAGGAAEFAAPPGQPPAGAAVPGGFDPADLAAAAAGLLDDDARRAACGAAAAARAESLDVARLAEVYREAVRPLALKPAAPKPPPGRRVAASLSARPRVSVVLTSFDYGAYVGEAIASVAAQTTPPAELLIVDDGSSDDSVERIRAAIAGLPFPVRFEATANRGQAAAMNLAFSWATGEVIAFLDSDDRWEPTKLERMLALMAAVPGGGLYQHQLGDGAGALKREVFQSGDVYRHWELTGRVNVADTPNPVDLFLPTTALVALKETLDGVFPLDERLITCPDALITRACVAKGPLVSHPEVLGIWRRHGQNAGASGRFSFGAYWLPVVLPAINAHYEATGAGVRFVHRRPEQERPDTPRPLARKLRPTKHNAVRLLARLNLEAPARLLLGR